jgi:hypothetical protein
MKIVKSKYRGTKEYAMVYTGLITAAKNRGTFKYQEIAKILGIPTVGKQYSRATGQILAEISEDEVSVGRPMLSAIAVGVKGTLGRGFYNLARALGKLSAGEDEEQFWKKECQAVYDAWKAE